MKITKVKKSGNGYNVHLENCDMIAFVHLPEEIDGLKKDGWIKPDLKMKLKTQKKK